MAESFLLEVDPTGIAKREILYDFGEGHISNLNGQMDMVAHEAEGVNPMPETGDS